MIRVDKYGRIVGDHSHSVDDLYNLTTLGRALIKDATPPIASSTAFGLLKVGANLSVDGAGKLNASAPYTHPNQHSPGEIATDANNQFVSAAEKNYWNGKLGSVPVATAEVLGGVKQGSNVTIDAAGMISVAAPYSHPGTHPPGIIAQDANNQFVSAAEKTAWNAKLTSVPIATAAVLGGVKQGSNVTIDAAGVISVAAPYSAPGSRPYTYIDSVPTLRFLARQSAGTGATEALTVAEAKAMMGLGSAASAAATDFATSGHGHATATGLAPGFMSVADFNKLAGVAAGATAYTHPGTHPYTILDQLPAQGLLGRNAGAVGGVQALSAAEARTLLGLTTLPVSEISGVSGTVLLGRTSGTGAPNQMGPVEVRGMLSLTGWATKAYTNGTTTDVGEGTNLYYTSVRAQADAAAYLAGVKGAANGVASLDNGGKLPVNQLPAVAINDTWVVNSNAAMTALSAQRGDTAIRPDLSRTYVLSTDNPGTLSDWVEMLSPTAGVSSVFGRTGPVIAAATDYTGYYVRHDATGQGLNATQQGNARSNLGLGTASVANIGTGAADVSAGNHGHTTYALKTGDAFSGAISFGTWLGNKIDLWGGYYGLGVSGSTFELNLPAGAVWSFRTGGNPVWVIDSNGILTSGQVPKARLTGVGTMINYDAPATGDASTSQGVIGTDSRLTNARAPTAHGHPATEINDSTATGRSLVKAADAAVARSITGAEAALGSPGVSGYLLSSTNAGARSWVAPYSHPSYHAPDILNVSAAKRLVGRYAATAGLGQEISVGSGLDLSDAGGLDLNSTYKTWLSGAVNGMDLVINFPSPYAIQAVWNGVTYKLVQLGVSKGVVATMSGIAL
jgi:hypothetical protein